MGLTLQKMYKVLLTHFGHQHWWPVDEHYHKENNSDPRFEIIVGAILTQNTAWSNVEKALENLKKQKMLTIQTIADSDIYNLKTLIEPSGFFNQKAIRLKNATAYLQKKYRGNLNRFFHRELTEIRTELLSLSGIGPETADSILLYAGDHPIFVVDAYTRRISTRLPLSINGDTYEDIQHYFETQLQETLSLKKIIPVYKELHALLVEHAKHYCSKKNPFCNECPLKTHCSSAVFLS